MGHSSSQTKFGENWDCSELCSGNCMRASVSWHLAGSVGFYPFYFMKIKYRFAFERYAAALEKCRAVLAPQKSR